MRITRNKTQGICPICAQPLEVGGLGAAFSVTATQVRRGHPACVNRWNQASLVEARRRGVE